jgi:hypothetical protein
MWFIFTEKGAHLYKNKRPQDLTELIQKTRKNYFVESLNIKTSCEGTVAFNVFLVVPISL